MSELDPSQKYDLAVEAYADTLTEIETADPMTPPKAAELCARLMSYGHETALHSKDDNGSGTALFTPPDVELSLQQATIGNYRPLRQGLMEELRKALEYVAPERPKILRRDAVTLEFFLPKYGRDEINFAKMIFRAASIIPDQGVPFNPPRPAWMDERFNPSLK